MATDRAARTSTGPGRHLPVRMLLSFERPGRETPAATLLAALENCRCEADARAIDKQLVRQRDTQASCLCESTGITAWPAEVGRPRDHRQDSKGTRWMPWHLEAKKGVNDCDKPR